MKKLISICCSLALVATSGLIGRYLYSAVPKGSRERAEKLAQMRAVGRESVEKMKGKLAGQTKAISRVLSTRKHKQVTDEEGPGILYLVLGDLQLRALRFRLRFQVEKTEKREELIELLAGLEEVRLRSDRYAALNRLLRSWRFFHRWMALSTTTLLFAHVYVALRYANILGD